MELFLFLLLLLAASATFLLLHLLIPFLRRNLLDNPNQRSSHIRPTPRAGGLAFVLVSNIFSAFLFSLSVMSNAPFLALDILPVLLIPLSVVGFLDDMYDLPSFWRYLVQVVTAFVLILFSPLVLGSDSSLLFILCLISVTAVINFTNFMDGMDGLVGGTMLVAIAAAAFQSSSSLTIWVLVGSLFGFLFWNWSPARVFMGDVGSTFLGAFFAALVLQASTWSSAFALLLVLTPLFGDACICVLRRFLAGHRVFQAHRLHLYQRLHLSGWSHTQVSILYILATASLAIALLCGGLVWVITLSAFELLIGFWLDQNVAVPFVVASNH